VFGFGADQFLGNTTLNLRVGLINLMPIDLCIQNLGVFMAPERNNGLFCAGGQTVDTCQV